MEINKILEKFEIGKTISEIKMYTKYERTFYSNIKIKSIDGMLVVGSATKDREKKVELILDFSKIKRIHDLPLINNETSYILIDRNDFEVQCTIIL